MSPRDIAFLRDQLASVGIELRAAPPAAPPAVAAFLNAPVDRERVRKILVATGAPSADLEWLVASCPSAADAAAYRPPGSFGAGGCRAWQMVVAPNTESKSTDDDQVIRRHPLTPEAHE